MADENPDQNVEEEMLDMMEEELGTSDAASGDSDTDFETEMLAAMQEDSVAAGEPAGDAAAEGEEGGLEAADMLQAMMAETGADTSAEAETALAHAQSMLSGTDLNQENIQRLLGVDLSMIIELGRTEVAISTLLEWSEGSLIELDRVSGEAVDVYINGKPFARGEVVTIAENFGVRLTELLPYIPSP